MGTGEVFTAGSFGGNMLDVGYAQMWQTKTGSMYILT